MEWEHVWKENHEFHFRLVKMQVLAIMYVEHLDQWLPHSKYSINDGHYVMFIIITIIMVTTITTIIIIRKEFQYCFGLQRNF